MALSNLGRFLVSDPMAGRNGVGTLALTGVEIGDIIIAVAVEDPGTPNYDPGSYTNYFLGVCSVTNQVRQLQSADLSSVSLVFVILRP